MNLTQFATAAGADRKWLLNSSAILGKPLRHSPQQARWWGLVRILDAEFGLQLRTAAAIANRALEQGKDEAPVRALEDPSTSAAVVVDLVRYDSVATANLSRALVRETPRRRGRRSENRDPIGAAIEYGIDISLIESSMKRTPAERLAKLDANLAFVTGLHRGRR